MPVETRQPKEAMEAGAVAFAAHRAQLTGRNIRDMRNDLDPNLVIAPYQEHNAKGCGYNLTATEFVYSVVKKQLVPVRKSSQGDSFLYIPPCDTVLLLTREYIKLSDRLAGAFYSRVQLVSDGLGHISTTLDPGWKGMLLFAVNNPTRKKVKLVLSESADGTITYQGIATMVLNPVNTDGLKGEQVDPSLDNPAMRLDVLKKLVLEPKRLVADKKYQALRALISELENFEPAANAKTTQLNDIKSLLLKLEQEVNSYLSPEDIRGWLTALSRAEYGEFNTLQAKIMSFCQLDFLHMDQDEMREQLRQHIEAGYRECDYQLLCEQLEQIHALIQSRVPHIWKHYSVKRLLGFLLDHWKFCGIYTAVIAGLSILYQTLDTLSTHAGIFVTVIAAILPPLISYLLDHSYPPDGSER